MQKSKKMLIPFDGILELEGMLLGGQAFRWRLEDGWFHNVLFNNIISARQVDEGVEFVCGPDDESVIAPLFRDYLRLDDDLVAIGKTISKGEQISAAISKYQGLRILRQEPWECLVSFICSANSNIPRISTNVEDMARNFGQALEMNGHVRSAFPSPDALADAGEQKLRDLGLGFRAKYVAAAAVSIARGDVDLFSLREASYDEALEELIGLSGIGDKVGNCILLFALDKRQAFPVDVWIERAIKEWYPEVLERKLTRKAMRPWAQEFFGAYAGYANQYLFHGRRLQGKD